MHFDDRKRNYFRLSRRRVPIGNIQPLTIHYTSSHNEETTFFSPIYPPPHSLIRTSYSVSVPSVDRVAHFTELSQEAEGGTTNVIYFQLVCLSAVPFTATMRPFICHINEYITETLLGVSF